MSIFLPSTAYCVYKPVQHGYLSGTMAQELETKFHCQFMEVYRKDFMSWQSIAKRWAEFWGISLSMEECERRGRPTSARTADNSALMENMTCNNRRIAVSVLQHDLNLSNGILINTIYDLRCNKACAIWVPQSLTDRQRETMNGLCSVIFTMIFNQWLHHHTLETKYASMEWKHPSSQKIQDCEVWWQSIYYSVLRTQRRFACRHDAICHRNQCGDRAK
jgi:hypothetical protein